MRRIQDDQPHKRIYNQQSGRNMSFLDKMIDIAKPFANKSAMAASNGFSISVSEAQLNTLAVRIIADEPSLTRLNLSCMPGELVIDGEARVARLPVSFKTRLSLESCEITPARKVLVLRRLDEVELSGSTFITNLYARIVKTIICGLFGIDPARFSLKGISGLKVENDRITADLDAMGAQEALTQAVRTKLSENLPAWLIDPILVATGDVLFARVGISGVEIREGKIGGTMILLRN